MMYGLKQAAILSCNLIKKHLEPEGYCPIRESNRLWKHKARQTIFALTVDDFGIKYYNKEDVDHLLNVLRKHYEISEDWNGMNYCGLTFDWHCDNGYVDISMPRYVYRSLARFNHTKPT